VLLLALLTTASAAAAPAPGNCTQPGESVQVDFTALDVVRNGNAYAAQLDARVFCRDAGGRDTGEVSESGFSLWASEPQVYVNGQLATGESRAVRVLTPSGTGEVTISWPTALGGSLGALQLVYRVKSDAAIDWLNQWVDSGKSPIHIGPAFSATPEPASIALFGSGLMGAGSYLLLRRRAGRT
jgi:hypothetical protein